MGDEYAEHAVSEWKGVAILISFVGVAVWFVGVTLSPSPNQAVLEAIARGSESQVLGEAAPTTLPVPRLESLASAAAAAVECRCVTGHLTGDDEPVYRCTLVPLLHARSAR
jgi:hypothetical protein